MIVEALIAIVGIVVFFAAIHIARHAKTKHENIAGVIVAYGTAIVTVLALASGYKQSITIDQQSIQLRVQNDNISSLRQSRDLDDRAILSLVKIAGIQQRQILQSNTHLNDAVNGLNTLAELQAPREINEATRSSLAHFAARHRRYRYVLYAQPNVEDGEYILKSISNALRAGGVQPEMSSNPGLLFQAHRLNFLSARSDATDARVLYGVLRRIDHFASWQSETFVPNGLFMIVIGDRS